MTRRGRASPISAEPSVLSRLVSTIPRKARKDGKWEYQSRDRADAVE